jgi:hypothetical protein
VNLRAVVVVGPKCGAPNTGVTRRMLTLVTSVQTLLTRVSNLSRFHRS